MSTIISKYLIIHDSNDNCFDKIIKEKYPESVIISPKKNINPCVGCLGCWLKTPGVCVLNDSFVHMGKEISKCTELIFISKCVYGGFSPFVKNVIDRSISYMLPLFRKKGKRSYHHRRYSNSFIFTALFYSKDLTKEEKDTALELCKSNAALWDCNDYDVAFFDDINEVLLGDQK